MELTMRNWNGREIAIARSKGGVRVVTHPYDNLISTGCSPWPTPEILQKLYKSRQARAFSGSQLAICQSELGYYCDLQSLHSEDAITWSVFGTVAYSSLNQRETWIEELFKLLEIPGASADKSSIFLWRRIPHPDTLVPGGPEIDAGIITRNSIVLVEAKWLSGVGRGQGTKKEKDQIQLRGEFLSKYSDKLLPKARIHAVVGIGFSPDGFRNTAPSGILFRQSTWEQICSLPSHPLRDEVRRYYEWKKGNTSTLPSN